MSLKLLRYKNVVHVACSLHPHAETQFLFYCVRYYRKFYFLFNLNHLFIDHLPLKNHCYITKGTFTYRKDGAHTFFNVNLYLTSLRFETNSFHGFAKYIFFLRYVITLQNTLCLQANLFFSSIKENMSEKLNIDDTPSFN